LMHTYASASAPTTTELAPNQTSTRSSCTLQHTAHGGPHEARRSAVCATRRDMQRTKDDARRASAHGNRATCNMQHGTCTVQRANANSNRADAAHAESNRHGALVHGTHAQVSRGSTLRVAQCSLTALRAFSKCPAPSKPTSRATRCASGPTRSESENITPHCTRRRRQTIVAIWCGCVPPASARP
jgi:hypothetical protein